MSMKTIPQSLNIRSFILENFEQALLINDEAERNAHMNFCLVGGGSTGVELVGALAEIVAKIIDGNINFSNFISWKHSGFLS